MQEISVVSQLYLTSDKSWTSLTMYKLKERKTSQRWLKQKEAVNMVLPARRYLKGGESGCYWQEKKMVIESISKEFVSK